MLSLRLVYRLCLFFPVQFGVAATHAQNDPALEECQQSLQVLEASVLSSQGANRWVIAPDLFQQKLQDITQRVDAGERCGLSSNKVPLSQQIQQALQQTEFQLTVAQSEHHARQRALHRVAQRLQKENDRQRLGQIARCLFGWPEFRQTQNCFAKTGIAEEFFEELKTDFQILAVAPSCLAFIGDPSLINWSDLLERLKAGQQVIKQTLAQSRVEAVKNQQAWKKIRASLRDKEQGLKSCAPIKMIPELIAIDDPEPCSGVVVTEKNESMLLTARHCLQSQEQTEVKTSVQQAQVAVDYARVSAPDVNRNYHSFPSARIASSGQVPQLGQRFFLQGYPAYLNREPLQLSCHFIGYGWGQAPYHKTAVYLLRCPGAFSHLGGMSGGPLLDENGVLWGILNFHNVAQDRIGVLPIHRAGAEIKPGVSPPIGEKLCYVEFSGTQAAVCSFGE